MNDKANIAFVNSHTESIGSHYQFNTVIGKIFLYTSSLFIRQTGMIPADLKAVLTQHIVYLVRFFARGGINNAAFLLMFIQIRNEKVRLSCSLDNTKI